MTGGGDEKDTKLSQSAPMGPRRCALPRDELLAIVRDLPLDAGMRLLLRGLDEYTAAAPLDR